MVNITQAFRDRIAAGPNVTAIVGNQIANDAMPQLWDPPAIVFYILSGTVFADLNSAKAVAMEQPTFECRCIGRDRTEAENLAWELFMHMDGFAGIQSGVMIRDISRGDGMSYTFDPVSGGTDQRRFITQIDFVVTYDNVNTYPPATTGTTKAKATVSGE